MATQTKPKVQKFSLVGQELLSQGRTTEIIAKTDMTIVTAKVYAEKGGQPRIQVIVMTLDDHLPPWVFA